MASQSSPGRRREGASAGARASRHPEAPAALEDRCARPPAPMAGAPGARVRREGLSAEGRLLLACAADGPDPNAVQSLLDARLDWPRLIDRAVRHGLGPFCSPLSGRVVPGPPDVFRARLHEIYERHTARHVDRVAKLAGIGAALGESGITVAVLKGAALGSVVYRDPAFRTMGDVDLLVREDDLVAASRVLQTARLHRRRLLALGGVVRGAPPPPRPPDRARTARSSSSFTARSSRRAKRRVPVDELWERACLERIGGVPFRVLAPERPAPPSVPSSRPRQHVRRRESA